MKSTISILTIAMILILSFGCSQQYVEPAEKELADEPVQEVPMEPEVPVQTEETPLDSAPEEENVAELELEVTEKEVEEVTVTPVKPPVKYVPPADEPSSVEKDSCRCSFTWDPICSRDGKTYINRCLYQCFGGDLEDVAHSSQCPKKKGPINIYTDDVEFKYESDKWNGGFCWREMWGETGIRYCKNLIVNGRVNEDPAPASGNWLDEDLLVHDWKSRSDSSTIKLFTGDQIRNEEYNLSFQPLFEEGKYRLSFWARQDVAANNDWQVKLTLKDWWEKKPMPIGVFGCYEVSTEINGDEVYFEELPNRFRHYHYEFDVPLVMEQWDSFKRESSECEYNWDMIPHGYGLLLTAPTIGYAMFDDFVLEKIE